MQHILFSWRLKPAMNIPRPQTKPEPGTIQRPTDPAALQRGSKGSMHSPNPMFPQERGQSEISPSSPSAWYLGATSTLEGIKTERAIPELPPNIHHRTRSDSAWYLGATPTLEEIKTEKAIPELPPDMHRRTRSGFTSVTKARR